MDNETPASTEQESTKTNVKQKEKKSKGSKSRAKAKKTAEPSQVPEKTQEPEEESPPLPTPYEMVKELVWLRQAVYQHSQRITELESRLDKKRIMGHGGKVQIRDKQTGTIYPSKNNAYQSMLKAGELQELVDKGIFGPEPTKNNFGWFALVRAWPDRFEEVKPEDK